MWNFADHGETPSDEYLLATYDPLTPMRFVDPSAGVKGTKDLNNMTPEARKECRNMAKIKLPGSEVAPVAKTTTLHNMFTR